MFKEYLPQPTGYPHAHCASLIFFKDTLYCVWYVYQKEEFLDAKLCISSFNLSLKRWTQPRLLLDRPGRSQGNPLFFIFNNELYLLFVFLEGHYWNSARMHVSKCEPELAKVSEPLKTNQAQGMMIRHRPWVNGEDVILPAYDEEKKQTVLLKGTPPFIDWQPISTLDPGPIQGDIISVGKKEAMIILRSTDNERKIIRAHSADSCRSFPFVYSTPLHCPLSGVAAHMDPSGALFVAHNNTDLHKRSPLSLSISKDGLKSIYKSIDIEFGDGEFSYPDLISDSKGNLHLVYTNDRDKIGHYFLFKEDVQELMI